MAMPPEGSSSWVKHDDVWELSSGDVRFASLIVAVDGSSAAITMPVTGSPYDGFYVVRFARAGDGVAVTCGDAGEGVVWRPGAEVVPEAARAVYPRGRFGARGDTAIAELRVGATGAIELVDAEGRLRIAVARAPAAGTGAATQIAACGGALTIELIDHPATSIRHVESSMP